MYEAYCELSYEKVNCLYTFVCECECFCPFLLLTFIHNSLPHHIHTWWSCCWGPVLGGGEGGTHYMKVTTYAPPFRPPFFRSLENLYSFDPYILAKMWKMLYFDPYFSSKLGKMYSFDPPFFTLVAFRVDGQCWASLSETWLSTPRGTCDLFCATIVSIPPVDYCSALSLCWCTTVMLGLFSIDL